MGGETGDYWSFSIILKIHYLKLAWFNKHSGHESKSWNSSFPGYWMTELSQTTALVCLAVPHVGTWPTCQTGMFFVFFLWEDSLIISLPNIGLHIHTHSAWIVFEPWSWEAAISMWIYIFRLQTSGGIFFFLQHLLPIQGRNNGRFISRDVF